MQVFAKAVYGQIFGQVIQDVSVDVLFKLLLFDGNQFFVQDGRNTCFHDSCGGVNLCVRDTGDCSSILFPTVIFS